MDILLFISKFIYRIRYKLFIGTLITTLLVAYFSRFMPKTYTVNTSIYTGFASNSGIDNETKTDWVQLNNSFDNLINLIRAKKTLENVSIQLFAQNMMYGDPLIDNLNITALSYRNLLKIVPDDVKKLIDKTSLEKTIANLKQYKKEVPNNFLFDLFNQRNPHYSYNALKDVSVKRLGSSDIIEISYRTDDPGVALNTVRLINKELIRNYDDLRYKSTKDVTKYYEEQLEKYKRLLNAQEDALTNYNVENKIINYLEQTKAIAISYTDYENRYEEVQKAYNSSAELIKQFENQMSLKQKISKSNEKFVKALDEISNINRKITEIEIFSTDDDASNNQELQDYREMLKEAEQKVSRLADQMNEYKYSKEGVALDKVVSEWLAETIRNTKAKAEMQVMDERKADFDQKYEIFSPIGTQIKRKEREINITERSYLSALEGLNAAQQKEKNIQLSSSSLTTITPPTYPLFSDGGKRSLVVMATFLGSFIFILGCCLVIELSDRTLRDPERTKRLAGIPVLGAFIGRKQLKYRGYIKAINRKTISHICAYIDSFHTKNKPMIINLISFEKGEGKSFIAKYMMNYWESIDVNAKYVSYETDFTPVSKYYLYAQSIRELLYLGNEEIDILLVEYPPLSQLSIPPALLKEADINLIIANARRVWKESDDIHLRFLKEKSGDTPMQLLLNNASRDIVEGFIGQLPPYVKKGELYRISQLGLTAEDAAVK